VENLSDEALIREFLRGEQAMFETLVRRYEAPLGNFIYRYLGDAARTEEIFQEVFLRVYTRAAQFRSEGRFRSWLYAIAANLCRDELRRRPRSSVSLNGQTTGEGNSPLKERVPAPVPAPDEVAEQRELGRLIRAAVDTLPETQREVFLLYEYQGLSYREIAEALDRPLGTIKSQMHHALKHLRRKLEKLTGRGGAS
jgi:RNA polymerase sigma-70 factor (ECF subfamily)